MVETAKYDVLLSDGEFEVRKYDKIMVATVRDAPSKFQVLFRYITGANRSKSKIEMTSPVITSEKIAMTSPVLSDGNTMSFVVPSEYEEDAVPEPTDPRVSIDVVPERYVATVRFRGFAWKDSVRKQTRKLLKWLDEKGYTIKGDTFLMQYNPPYVPGFLRRNEVGAEIEYSE
jgi:effector-binding domain-containing protein